MIHDDGAFIWAQRHARDVVLAHADTIGVFIYFTYEPGLYPDKKPKFQKHATQEAFCARAA